MSLAVAIVAPSVKPWLLVPASPLLVVHETPRPPRPRAIWLRALPRVFRSTCPMRLITVPAAYQAIEQLSKPAPSRAATRGLFNAMLWEMWWMSP